MNKGTFCAVIVTSVYRKELLIEYLKALLKT